MSRSIISFIKSKLRYKIMFFLFILMTLSALVTIFATTNYIKQANIKSTQTTLEVLNESIFQSLRTAMNTGDPEQIAKAENHARNIKGIDKLVVEKSQPLIELFGAKDPFTTDKDILKALKTKQPSIIETTKGAHKLRMIKPMVATDECLACHSNQQKGDVIGVLDLTFSLETSDDGLFSIMTNIFIIITLLGWGTLIIVFLLLKKSTQPIEVLEDAIKALSTDDHKHNKIVIDSTDEIRKVADYFNLYVEKAQINMNNDLILITEAKQIIEKVKMGDYSASIISSTANKQLEEFKISVNEMIAATNDHLQNINKILLSYSNYDYTKDVALDGIEEQCVVSELAKNINNVKDSITLTLIANQTNGQALGDGSDELIENVNRLSVSTNSAATSLEETAAALEQITTNIRNTTSDVVTMSTLANQVTISAIQGEKLSTQTTQAMEDIDHEVSSISEAIRIIDQIAFQTNILSLNAAVEAATAGDAGRGFAIVAGEVRNLASRSADAANEIKKLVENATNRANSGRKIAQSMTIGYTTLKEAIDKTMELIKNVETASKEQMQGISQINDTVNSLDGQTQQNALIASKVFDIAKQTDQIAKLIIADLETKKFKTDLK